MDSDELLPCPFCGGQVFITQLGTHVVCMTPNCCVGPTSGVLAWNTRAALTPPEGYVLVPVEPTEEMIEAICNAHGSGGWPQGYGRHAQHIRREHAGEGYRAALAARPEVSP